MKCLFLVYAFAVLILSVYALPQEDSSANNNESTKDVPISDSSAAEEASDAVDDESAMDESVPFGDEIASQDSVLERGAEPEKYPKEPEKYPKEPEKYPKEPEKYPKEPEKYPQKPQKPGQPWRPPTSPNIPCTTYTEAGRKQREEAVKICMEKGPDNVECVRKFCSAANGPTLQCNANCLKCPPSSNYQYNKGC